MTKTILITGAAIRIGRELALHFARKNWQVAAHYNRSADAAETLQKESGGRIRLFQADLSAAHAADRLYENAVKECGPLASIINNAALFERDESSNDARNLHYAVNVAAPVRLVELLAASGAKDAAAINILDATLEMSREKLAAYATSKEELEHWTQNAARRLMPKLRLYGVKVGPTLRNPRESQAHFDRAVAAARRKGPTPLAAITETLEKLLADTSYSLDTLHDLS